MNYISKIINRKKYLLLASVVIAILFVMIFQGAANSINQNVYYALYRLNGERAIDSNIVIINIDKNDILKLKWPLKRNIYALLINRLTELEAKKIGIEIFLSPDSEYQSIYNKLLLDELSKTNNVILGSQLFGIKALNDSIYADSIGFPLVKEGTPSIKTGHLNYLLNTFLKIPTEVYIKNLVEFSFVSSLLENSKHVKENNGLIHLNLHSSWKSYRNYSLLEFFDKIENSDFNGGEFRNKFVIVGVSDPGYAVSFQSAFDDYLPGVGLHALALDNILNGRAINKRHGQLFDSISLLIIIFITFFKIRNKIIFVFALLGFLFFSFLLLNLFNIVINYSFFLIPFLIYSFTDFVLFLLENKLVLRHVINEAEILKVTLQKKKDDLGVLQRELDLGEKSSTGHIVEKIAAIKKEIKKLKESQHDSKPYQSESDSVEVENFNGLIFKSREMNNLVNIIKRIAPEEANVLILGESGSGKELVAKALHNLSPRKNKNFVAVNCGALTETLLESELFGHVKGAFTNASNDKTGRFEQADEGTIFLDEIGETSENFQVKLLRIIQTGEFEKVGSSDTRKLNVRIIAATNKNLEEMVRNKKFREDLYYRLNVIKIKLPPLRERKEDIPVLAEYFMGKEDSDMTFTRGVVSLLNEHEWKGNVRELESVIKRAVIFARSEKRNLIQVNDLPEELCKYGKSDLESMILDSLREKGFSYSSINATARELGNLSRGIISENFRGILFKSYVINNYNEDKTIKMVTGSENEEELNRVRSKLRTYLQNISVDLNKQRASDFESAKLNLISKYKNLPQRYHIYLDKIIQFVIDK